MNKKVIKPLKQFIEISQNMQYFKSELVKRNIRIVEFLPLGVRLKDNLKTEWINQLNESNIVNLNKSLANNTFNSFEHIQSVEYRNRFEDIKNNIKCLPFMLSECIESQSTYNQELCADDDIEINLKNSTILHCTNFINESQSNEVFYNIQRQRKIWWMKFSADPGRFFISQSKSTELSNKETIQSISINSKFEFGICELEKIYSIPLNSLDESIRKSFAILDSNIVPTAITSSILLEKAVLAVLFDGIDSSELDEICLNRRISPYHCCIHCIVEDNTLSTDFKDLAKYLTMLMEKKSISVFYTNFVNNEYDLNGAFKKIDNMGIPYSLILDSESLDNGLIRLRSRDTTLSETLHVIDIPNYLLKIISS